MSIIQKAKNKFKESTTYIWEEVPYENIQSIKMIYIFYGNASRVSYIYKEKVIDKEVTIIFDKEAQIPTLRTQVNPNYGVPDELTLPLSYLFK